MQLGTVINGLINITSSQVEIVNILHTLNIDFSVKLINVHLFTTLLLQVQDLFSDYDIADSVLLCLSG